MTDGFDKLAMEFFDGDLSEADARRLAEHLETHQGDRSEFIALARSVYRLNDRRAALKRQISEATDSELVEVKSYPVG